MAHAHGIKSRTKYLLYMRRAKRVSQEHGFAYILYLMSSVELLSDVGGDGDGVGVTVVAIVASLRLAPHGC